MMILMMVQKTGTAGETMTFASSLRATLLPCGLNGIARVGLEKRIPNRQSASQGPKEKLEILT